MLFKGILFVNPSDFELQRKVDFSFSVQWPKDIMYEESLPGNFFILFIYRIRQIPGRKRKIA